jgi:phage-related protein
MHAATPKESWEVIFYEAANGNRPAESWFQSLPVKVQAKFAWIFDLLEEHGTNVTRPHVDQVRDKIWEVRVERSGVQYRLLYFAGPDRQFVMLHGLTKAQKIPSGDIDLAEQRMNDYMQRRKATQKKGG